ncbi:hypothetical protein PFISCL1PPCAC_11508, partial [Pristionchus fissidentatus]
GIFGCYWLLLFAESSDRNSLITESKLRDTYCSSSSQLKILKSNRKCICKSHVNKKFSIKQHDN